MGNAAQPVLRFCDRCDERRLSLHLSCVAHGGSGHETSLELRCDYCRSRDRRTGFSAAYRSRPLRANWYRSRRQSPRWARPIFSALQSTGWVAWPARCDAFVGGPDAGDDVPTARCDTPCGLDAITVTAAFIFLSGGPYFGAREPLGPAKLPQ